MADDTHAEAVQRAASLLAPAQSVLFVTGAGISADSGLPTYRGVGGLYDGEDAEEGLPIEVCLSGEMFRTRPALTWKYMHEIGRACRGAEPNAAHRAIAALEAERERVWVLTQNVDGLHAAAGSKKLIAIHGDAHELACTRCSWSTRVADYDTIGFGDDGVPRCPKCGAIVRPAVILFGEMLPSRALETLYAQLDLGFDAVVSIGTTAVFPYIAAPIQLARAKGKATIEINPGSSEISSLVDVHLRLGAAEAMTQILAAMNP